jgi:hypothetical protein
MRLPPSAFPAIQIKNPVTKVLEPDDADVALDKFGGPLLNAVAHLAIFLQPLSPWRLA